MAAGLTAPELRELSADELASLLDDFDLFPDEILSDLAR